MIKPNTNPKCAVCRKPMHAMLSGKFRCQRKACGKKPKPVARGSKPPAKRKAPRRGRVVDKPRLEWAATQPCQITGQLPATTHHVRFCGSPKSDERIIRLAPELHMHGFGDATIEHGKAQFELAYGRMIEDLIMELKRRYESTQ